MTEQPAEPMTEQAFLGNVEVGAVEFLPVPEIPLQHYAPNAHRIAPPRLTPPTGPAIAMDRPYNAIRANALLLNSINAAAKLLHARQAAKQAEDAMSDALAVEGLAEIDSVNADRALIDFAREAAEQ